MTGRCSRRRTKQTPHTKSCSRPSSVPYSCSHLTRMTLRSRRTARSAKDSNRQCEVSSSDEDKGSCEISDSDYQASGDEEDAEEEHIDLSCEPWLDSEFCDKESIGNVTSIELKLQSRKKVCSAKKRERQGYKKDQEVVFFHSKDEEIKKGKKNKKSSRPKLMWKVWEEENNKWVEENMETDTDFDYRNEIFEPPSSLIMPLLRYQKEWLAWALKQEESAARGGILADEMGMGKTIQAIALVLAKRESCVVDSDPIELLMSLNCSLGSPKVKSTLIICPVVAIKQWATEIDRFTSKGSSKVLVYHGPNRVKNLHEFVDYDFVITTYSIVESEYRKWEMPPKQRCKWCGKLFDDAKLSVHLKYYCGPYAVKTEKQSKQQRKKPKLSNPKTIEKGKLNDSEDEKRKAVKPDVVGKESGEDFSVENVKSSYSPMNKSLLHSLKWERIILDEAHYIKDRSCNTTRAVLALESSYKWALSGTPLQNRVGELYSLVRFLQVVPYSYYFCKDCDCRALDYNINDCLHCPHKSVRHFCWWNKYIASPIQKHGNSVFGLKAMALLKQKILKSIVLRRTKKGRAADLALPHRIVTLRRDNLDIKEEDYYVSLYNESQAQFNTYIDAGTVMNNYAHIFDLLTRLRQAVDHPYLVVYSTSGCGRRLNMVDPSNSEQACGICHDPIEDPVVASCEHLFCKSCLIDLSADVEQLFCPSCSKPVTVDFTKSKNYNDQIGKTIIRGLRASSILNRINLDDFQTSTKIDALREEIRFMVERDGSAKGIVFSQFTSFLDLIHYSLQQSGINCVRLVGSMSVSARDAAISKFTGDPDCRIFLMSLKAGGVALNLTIASHVFLMDPWWNPAVERQAQDRIHRIGQYKPIRIVRFVIENTIEERILKLQEKKELVFEGTVGGSEEAFGRLTEADMRFLFVT